MTAKKQDIIKRAKQWTIFADDDLRIARHAFKLSSSCPYRIIAYHAQQCAEKYLKAFLVYKNVDFPYTHNLSRLLELCLPHGNWIEKLRVAEELTPYAVTARYPEQREKVSKKDAEKDIKTRRFNFIGVHISPSLTRSSPPKSMPLKGRNGGQTPKLTFHEGEVILFNHMIK